MRDQFGIFDQLVSLGPSNLAESVDRWQRQAGQALAAPVESYFLMTGYNGTPSTGAPPVGTLRCAPFLSGRGGLIDKIAFEVTTLGAAGSVGRFGLYASDPATMLPTTLLFDSGSIATDGGGTGLKTAACAIGLQQGVLVWTCSLFGVASPTMRVYSQAGITPIFGFGTTGNFNTSNMGWTVAQAFGALPATFPAGATFLASSGVVTIVGLRYTTAT